MKHILLLGAGFSRNWGGWLASEVFEYLLGCPEVRKNQHLRRALWKSKDEGGFEQALSLVQIGGYLLGHTELELPAHAVEAAPGRMFGEKNTALLAWTGLGFPTAQ